MMSCATRAAGQSDKEIEQIKAAAPAKARVQPAKPRKVLVFNLCKGFKHSSVPYGAKALEIMGAKTGAFEVVCSEDIGMFAADKLAAFDAVVMNNTTGELFAGDPREDQLKKSLMDFVRGGKGIMGIHAATDCFYKWPEYGQMMGGYFHGHPWNEQVGVKLDEPGHPLNAAFGGKGFEVADEIYQFRDPYSRKELRVLLSLDLARTNMNKGGINRKDGDFAVAWCRAWGRGRVYYMSLGHRHEIFWNPPLLQAYLDGAQFVCGDLKADTDPAAAPAGAAPGPDPRLGDALKAVAAYAFGQSHQPLITVEEIVFASSKDPAARQAVAAALANVLSGQATDDGKSFICRMLWVIGDKESVPALAGLLGHEKLSDMARYGLERMEVPEAGAALREALPRLKGRSLIGLINTLGQRRDVAAGAEIAARLKDSDSAVAEAAARALGKIGGPKAADSLLAVRGKGPANVDNAVVDSLLKCAESLAAAGGKDQSAAIFESLSKGQPLQVRIAALHGLLALRPEQGMATVTEMLAGADPKIAALGARFVRDIPGPQATQAFVAQLPRLAPAGQVLLLDALAGRGDAAALSAIAKCASADDAAVRQAALRALGEIGDASVVGVLAKATVAGEDADKRQARDSLTRLKGNGVDAAIVALLKGGQESTQVELIRVLTDRRAAGIEQALLEAIASATPAVQAEAIRAMGVLGDHRALAPLVATLTKTQDDAVRQAAEKAAASVVVRVGEPSQSAPPVLAGLNGAQPPARVALLRVLAKIGGPQTLTAVRGEVDNADPAVAEAAIRALADWPDAAAIDDARKLAKSAPDARLRIIALRGFVRQAAINADATPPQRVQFYQDAMNLAARVEDKKMVLSAIAQAKDPAALKLVAPCLDDEALAAEACQAVVGIAQAAIASDPEHTRALLEKVVQAAKDQGVRNAARQIIQAAERFEDFVVAWQIAGPYTNGDLWATAYGPEKPDGKVEWKPMPAGPADRPWLLELDKTLGGGNDRAAYLRTNVYSPKAQEVILEVGSDDGVKVWIEGKLVHQNNAVRPCSPGQDKAKVALKEGWNAVLMKVTQGGGEWQACVRFRTTDGKKVQGLRANPTGRGSAMHGLPAMLGASVLAAAEEPADPIMGEYAGVLTAGNARAEAVGRVIAEGKGNYRLVIVVPSRKPSRIELTGVLKDGKVELSGGDGWKGQIADKKAQASGREMSFEGEFAVRKSPTLGAKPPAGAVVLLPFEEGKKTNLDEWQNKNWTLCDDGSMEVNKGNNKTVKSFGSCQLHIEFRCPFEPEKRGQGRGNSGVYLQDRYEIQVLDSFGLASKSNDCGGVYGVAVAKENACLPPLAWQTYDITFRAAKFDADGKMIARPCFVKVLHNGVLIHENVEIPKATTAAGSGGHAPKGPLHLQDHGNKVRYRNIWIVEQGE